MAFPLEESKKEELSDKKKRRKSHKMMKEIPRFIKRFEPPDFGV